MFKINADINVAIAAGLAEELLALGIDTDVYGPAAVDTEGFSIKHAMVIGKHRILKEVLCTIKIAGECIVKCKFKKIHNELVANHDERTFEINSPTMVIDIVTYLDEMLIKNTEPPPLQLGNAT